MLSILGFIGRGVLLALNSPVMSQKWVKVAPHIIDTILLGTAISLVIGLGLSVWQTPWLLAKIAALIVYIGLGVVVMRIGKTWPVRAAAWGLAVMVFGYIVAVAMTKNPMLF